MWKVLVKTARTGICCQNQIGSFWSKTAKNVGSATRENSSGLSLCSKLRSKVIPYRSTRQHCVLPRKVKSSLLQNWNNNCVQRKKLKILGVIAFGCFLYYITHLQTAPYTERKRFIAFTKAQMSLLSKFVLEQLLEQYEEQIRSALCFNHLDNQRIHRVVQRLIKGGEGLPEFQGFAWTVTVVDDDDTKNAFVLPCGSIFVFTGLLKEFDSDDQLAIILGHEMAHAIMEHSAESVGYSFLTVIPLAILWTLLPADIIPDDLMYDITSNLSKILLELPRSRLLEEEADHVGLILAAQACFDIREAPVVWEKFGLLEEDTTFEWLSTHPSCKRRQAQLEKLLPMGMDIREKCECPELPWVDPRSKIIT